MIYSQNKPIVSLTNGNYWIYSSDYSGSLFGGPSHHGLIKKKVMGDTIINNISCKKIETADYDISGSRVSKYLAYEYWYSDSVIFSKYNGSSFHTYYDARMIHDSISGYQRMIVLSSEDIFFENRKTQHHKWEGYDSSNYDSTFSEKYGLISTSIYYRHYYLVQTRLIGAKIDNVYYGESRFFPVTSITVNDLILSVEYELLSDNEQIDKIIIYNRLYDEQSYKAMDSINTTVPYLRISLKERFYDLKFTYRNKSGIESIMTDNFSFYPQPISPLSIEKCNIVKCEVEMNFSVVRNDIQIEKIFIYNHNEATDGYDLIDSVNTNIPSIRFKLMPGSYTLKFSYLNKDGNQSMLTQYPLSVYIEPIASLLINKYNITGNTLEVEFGTTEGDTQFQGIMIYSYNKTNNRYEWIDSVETNKPILKYILPTGDYNLKFSYINVDGFESDLSEEIRFFSGIIDKYTMSQNYPNPFNPKTTINYSLPETCHVTIIIYNILGMEVATLLDTEKTKGVYSIDFNASNLSSGFYYYRLKAEGFSETKKMLLLK